VIEIEFNEAERKEYDRVQTKAADMYQQLKMRGNVNRHYLRLTSALLPLRVSCSGGHIEEGQIKRKGTPKEELTGNELEFDIEAGTECAICLDNIEEPRATTCKPVPHIFCKECIEGVFSGAQSVPCPCCRSSIKAAEMRVVVPKPDADNGEGDEDEEPEEEKKPAKKKKNVALKDSDILFRSKFERLLVELNRIRDDEPECAYLLSCWKVCFHLITHRCN